MTTAYTVTDGVRIEEINDSTKVLILEVDSGSTTSTTTTLQASQTANRIVILPDDNDTLVGRKTTDTMTNKTIVSTTNTVRASELATTGAAVDVVSAAPPSTGQILKATSATTATWQVNTNTITNSITTATADSAVAPSGYTVINTMTITPVDGTYLVMFSTSADIDTQSSVFDIAIHNGGTITQHTERTVATGGGPTAGMDLVLHTQSIETTSESTIDVRVIRRSGAGTITFHERSLILVQVS